MGDTAVANPSPVILQLTRIMSGALPALPGVGYGTAMWLGGSLLPPSFLPPQPPPQQALAIKSSVASAQGKNLGFLTAFFPLLSPFPLPRAPIVRMLASSPGSLLSSFRSSSASYSVSSDTSSRCSSEPSPGNVSLNVYTPSFMSMTFS